MHGPETGTNNNLAMTMSGGRALGVEDFAAPTGLTYSLFTSEHKNLFQIKKGRRNGVIG